VIQISDEPRTVASNGITAAKFDKWFDGRSRSLGNTLGNNLD